MKIINGIIHGTHAKSNLRLGIRKGQPWARAATDLEQELWRDSETLRLIIQHKMDIHYSRFTKPVGFYASTINMGAFLPGKDIHAAVRNAAKVGKGK